SHQELLDSLCFSTVRNVTMGSSPVSDELLQRIERWFPNSQVNTSYGTTESGPGVFAPHPGGLPTPRGSVGTARDVPEIRLVNAEGKPTSSRGTLEVRSPSLMLGYRNRPEVTVPITSDGFHHTGDIF